jgi:hypothetical protein
MTSDGLETPRTHDATSLAPPWHTALLVGLLLSVALTGTLLTAGNPAALAAPESGSRITSVYVPMVLVAWGLVLFACRLGRRRFELFSLLGVRWTSPARVGTDLALASIGFLLVEGVEMASAQWFGVGHGAASLALLPHGTAERLAWLVVAVSAGFCEEVVYRGYLQTQLSAFTRRASLGVVLQAALFGIAHLQQGVATAGRFTLYGFGLGALAAWRRTLLPGIVCHIAIDLVSGLLA